jgi:hypothetical protein
VSQTRQPFKNQGDCVNDGAQRLGVQPAPLDPQTVCESLPGDTFTSGEGREFIWDCSWESPPQESPTLSDACAQSGGSEPEARTRRSLIHTDRLATGLRT